jgi:hypothetical protein
MRPSGGGRVDRHSGLSTGDRSVRLTLAGGEGIRQYHTMIGKADANSDNGGDVSAPDEHIPAQGLAGHRACMDRMAQREGFGIKGRPVLLGISDHAHDVQLCTRWVNLYGRKEGREPR